MDAHELVVQIKDLALQLGHTPSRREFESHIKGGAYKLNKFGGYTLLLKAAGLDTYEDRRAGKSERIDSTIFERNLERHLEEQKPASTIQRKPWPKIAVISDIHWPFQNERILSAFFAYIESNQPEWVILNGDAWDMYSHAKFPRSHNVFVPREEERLARAGNEKFWMEVKARCPDARCYQLLGNHDIRPMKRVLETYPEAEDWIAQKLKDLFTFEGVTTIQDAREELIIGDIMVHHGYRSQLGAHRDYTLMNSINGHTHRGGAVFRQIRGQVLWELNSGLAGDATKKGLTYTSQRMTDWTPGFGWVDSHGPRFIPA
jgi:predicted phosphodiesterase